MGASRGCASGCKPSHGNFCGIGEDCPPMENRGRCRLRVGRVRFRGMLVFRCVVATHDHGEPHWLLRTLRPGDLLIDPDTLYQLMTKDGGD